MTQDENKSIVRQNAEKDPGYAPYCLRCSTMQRMTKIRPFEWRCHCGAIHDERRPGDPTYDERCSGGSMYNMRAW